MILINNTRRFMSSTSANFRLAKEFVVLPLLILPLFLMAINCSFAQDTTTATAQKTTPAKTWIDLSTGHRVTRLTGEPNSVGLYFDANAYTPDGLDMVYTSHTGIYSLNLSTQQAILLVDGKQYMISGVVVGTKTRRVFFQKYLDRNVYAVDIDTKKVTQVAALPYRANLSTVNADETLLAGTYIEGSAPGYEQYKAEALLDSSKEFSIEHSAHPDELVDKNKSNESIAKAHAVATEKYYASHTPEDIFTVNIQTGQIKTILKGTDWLNHVQFSPTDPTLLMYAHEGPSLKVDRIWTIRADGSNNKLIRQRMDPSEIATHEFWSHDGKTIWYDLQTSKGEDFAIGGYKVESGKEVAYHMNKAEASVHYNISTNDRFFCSDGNESAHDNKAGIHGHMMLQREWIKILRPFPDDSLHSIRLVDLSKNDYARSEPNARFSPDNKMVIFTSNMFGPNYIFAVEVGKAKADSATSTSASN
ncbi:MAG: oligogalacturonate lyase family protein [Acidobacteriaceae bacterium]|nr:oligogalacturonate lyase family protein [Acidobacteriaceae bacterium]